jgi:uncharacterized protein with FMN-binding domain
MNSLIFTTARQPVNAPPQSRPPALPLLRPNWMKFASLASVGLTILLAATELPGSPAEDVPAIPALQQALAQLKVPPDWFGTTQINWDTNKPWKDARLEIRRLLALDEAGNRQGVKLTWLHAQKGDIGEGHELPMYLFMSGNYAWATLEYPKYLRTVTGKGPTHAYLCYASCLAHFGGYQPALNVLDQAMNDLPPKPWRIANLANIHNHYGDLYARLGNTAKAGEHYTEAIRLYPTSDQPYGRHLLHRHAAKVKTKLDLLAMQALQAGQLRDGTYTGRSIGYADQKEMEVTVTLRGGRIADVKVKHQEKIDLNATTLIPQRIVAAQSLKVDGITGATVTSQAIVDGAFQALKQAGMK